MVVSAKVTGNISSVKDFPWDRTVMQHPWGVFLDAKTPEEMLYTSGRLVERVTAFIEDDERTEFINWGLGPTAASDAPSPKPEAGAGTFGTFVALKPADLDLYRAVLPENYSMPDQPALSLVTVDYNQPNPIARYREGMVLLNAIAADGEQTWYCHSMPVETWVVLAAGHAWGFRKDLFDITVTREGSTVRQRDGELYMSLELTPFAWGEDEDAVVPEGGLGGINNMSAVYPRDPDLVLRFCTTGGPEVQEEDRKKVKITVNRDLDWAGLVPEGTVASGLFQRTIPRPGTDSYIKKVRS